MKQLPTTTPAATALPLNSTPASGHQWLSGGWWLALLLWLTAPAAWAQGASWQSVYLAGGNAYSSINAVATDASGNVYVGGYFSNATITLGSITLTNAVTSGSAAGFSNDAFVAKWSPATGTFVWAQRAGGTGAGDVVTALAVSGTSVYAVATINGPGFGGGPALSGDQLIKFTESGSVSWMQPAGMAIARLVATGSVLYAVGSVTGTASVGGTSLSSAGSLDLVVAKLADTGSAAQAVWVQQVGGPGYDAGVGLAVDGPSVYLTGTYGTPVAFGSIAVPVAGSCVAKLVDAGASSSFAWVQPVAGVTFGGLAAYQGRVYVLGSFASTVTLSAVLLTSNGQTNTFVARVLDAGTSASFAWAQALTNLTNNSVLQGLAANASGVYVSGALGAANTFGTITLPAPASAGLFVARLTELGNYLWAVPASAYFSPFTSALALSGTTVYLAGLLAGPVAFGEHSQGASGGPVAFLAVLADNTALATVAPAATSVLAGLTLAPNPAHGTATVQVPAVAGATTATLTLRDALGRVVRSQAAVPGTASVLDLKGIAAGVYLVHVQAESAQAAQRLVVE